MKIGTNAFTWGVLSLASQCLAASGSNKLYRHEQETRRKEGGIKVGTEKDGLNSEFMFRMAMFREDCAVERMLSRGEKKWRLFKDTGEPGKIILGPIGAAAGVLRGVRKVKRDEKTKKLLSEYNVKLAKHRKKLDKESADRVDEEMN